VTFDFRGKWIYAVLGTIALTGCAHLPGAPRSDNSSVALGAQSARTSAKNLAKNEISVDSSAENTQLGSQGEIYFRGMKLEHTDFDFPVTLNSRVEYWVDYFTGRGRGYFEKYLERSELFIPYIRPLLKENGLPQDLVYLAMIESGFNNHARSHMRAVGPWQFISATGKRYGLLVNWWVDERRDTRKSTLAAVEYLRDLYGFSIAGSLQPLRTMQAKRRSRARFGVMTPRISGFSRGISSCVLKHETMCRRSSQPRLSRRIGRSSVSRLLRKYLEETRP